MLFIRFSALIFAITCGVFSTHLRADVTAVEASIDKNPVMADESVTLTVTANGDVARDAFDPSPLLSDFVVGRTSVSSQTQMINFKTSRSTTWSTVLIPRKEGTYQIPAFTIDGQSSQPISLMVVPVSASQSGRGRDIYITTEVDKQQVYLQQQLRYTIKLHLAQDLQRGSLQAPVLENADIRQLGKDAEYSDIINGRRYRIIERNFAIIPQQSGQYTINGPLFEGEVLANTRQSFGFFNRTRTINQIGPSIDIEVLPVPADVTDHWLPSEMVQLNEEWQSSDDQYRVGEPITRTLTLSALGLVEEQLPEIPKDYPPSIKVYPDQANTATVEQNNNLIAQRVESIALIPGREGNFVIPGVSVPWYNTRTGQVEYASLPARSIKVGPAAIDPQAAPLPAIPEQQTQPATVPDQAPQAPVLVTQPGWWSVSSWIFFALWLVTLLLWWLSRRNGKQQQHTLSDHNSNEASLWRTLQSALKTSNAEQIRLPLTEWLALSCGKPGQSLPASQMQLRDPALDDAISSMFASRYSEKQEAWQATALNSELQRIRQRIHTTNNNKHQLAGLYPQTS